MSSFDDDDTVDFDPAEVSNDDASDLLMGLSNSPARPSKKKSRSRNDASALASARRNGKGKRKSKTNGARLETRAGLQFPVGRTRRYLRSASGIKRIGRFAPVFMAAVMEYLAAEIWELAGNAARDNKRKRITARHIQLAVRDDEELNELLRNVHIDKSGVIPNIHAVLLPPKKMR